MCLLSRNSRFAVFVEVDGDHRDLHVLPHSFPTRRSSDLFDDNRLLPLLYGEHDKHLAQIERKLGISLISRGNHLAISGPSDSTDVARVALRKLYRDLKRGHVVDEIGRAHV